MFCLEYFSCCCVEQRFMKHLLGRKDFEVIVYGSYNVKTCGEFDEICLELKGCDAKEELAIKDIV